MEAIATSTLRKDLDPLKTPPLVLPTSLAQVRQQLDAPVGSGGLGTWSELPVFSLHHHRRANVEALATVGAGFLAKVRQRGSQSGDASLLNRLVTLWGGDGMTGVALKALLKPTGPRS